VITSGAFDAERKRFIQNGGKWPGSANEDCGDLPFCRRSPARRDGSTAAQLGTAQILAIQAGHHWK
jgi:hypothetical protein